MPNYYIFVEFPTKMSKRQSSKRRRGGGGCHTTVKYCLFIFEREKIHSSSFPWPIARKSIKRYHEINRRIKTFSSAGFPECRGIPHIRTLNWSVYGKIQYNIIGINFFALLFYKDCQHETTWYLAVRSTITIVEIIILKRHRYLCGNTYNYFVCLRIMKNYIVCCSRPKTVDKNQIYTACFTKNLTCNISAGLTGRLKWVLFLQISRVPKYIFRCLLKCYWQLLKHLAMFNTRGSYFILICYDLHNLFHISNNVRVAAILKPSVFQQIKTTCYLVIVCNIFFLFH